ncbi:MAG: aminoglycoside N(3)-acetyltransferase [Halobacteriota archaeon]
MSEADAIERVEKPVTAAQIRSELSELGVEAGDTVLVHASLSSLGWVSGGPQAVVEALQATVTESGTLLMPAHTGQFTDPADWENPPVPGDWVETIRETRPPFRPEATPSRGVGTIAETFRSYPDVSRSGHPIYSFSAWGSESDRVLEDHTLDYGLGPDSPLGGIYERDGSVLCLGTGHGTNTSLHLAEYLAAIDAQERTRHAPILQEGTRVEVEYRDIELDVSDFADLGAAFEAAVGCDTGTVGAAETKLVDQRALVDFAVEWLESHRG